MSNTVVTCNSSNQILAGLLSGDLSFKPNVMYVEFQTGSSSVLDLPVVDPADSEYYLQLRDNTGSTRDFLRIPIASTTVQKGSSPDDIAILFNGICVGTTGVGGKDTSGSMIYGVALAVSPTYGITVDDMTRDILWARGYYDSSNQMPFSTLAQTLITFKLNLTISHV